ESVRDPHLRVLLNRIVADHTAQLREWPAAQTIHHAYRGGLLEHMLKMEDLVLAGAILHDIGKLQELSYEPGGATYSRDGNLVGHIGLGLILVRETAN